MFADIVPEHLRSTVYAFDRSFEGAVAACAAPLVGELYSRFVYLSVSVLLSVCLFLAACLFFFVCLLNSLFLVVCLSVPP